MGKRGPNKEPFALKERDGRVQPHRDQDNLVKFLPNFKEMPPVPDTLSAVGENEWIRIWDYAITIPSWIMPTDLSALEDHCFTYQLLISMRKKIKKTPNSPIDREEFKTYKDLNVMYRRSCADFGFTPSSRMRIDLVLATTEEKGFETL